MINNDVLRRLKYALDLKNSVIVEIFSLSAVSCKQEQLDAWLKKEDEAGFLLMPNNIMRPFLDGLIVYKRGPSDKKSQLKPEELTNNDILKKIRIALNMQEADMINALALAGLSVSKHELNALFRRPSHRNYKACGDQFLRNFLLGLAKKKQP